MAKYRIYVKSVEYLFIDVEAKDEDEARDIYKVIDGENFHSEPFLADWSIDEIMCLDDDEDVDYKAEDVLY